MVIYDPEDPHKNLYDVDDGKPLFLRSFHFVHSFCTESTIINLADWYNSPYPVLLILELNVLQIGTTFPLAPSAPCHPLLGQP